MQRSRELESTFSSALGRSQESNRTFNAMRRELEKENCEAVLLIDATSAFNLLNKTAALEIIRKMRTSLHMRLSNSYQTTNCLFVDKKAIFSREGCTHGYPLAMLMYGVAIKPLILKLQTRKIVQKWYADDGNAAGLLQQLHELFGNLSSQGSSFGYHVNAPK